MAVRAYAARNQGGLPPSLEQLVHPDASGIIQLGSSRVPKDAWGRSYRYEVLAASSGFRVYSLGADGSPGGGGDDRDVDNLMLGY